MNKKIYFTVIIAIISVVIMAQNAKQYYKAGEEFMETASYTDAIKQYTKAIDLNPKESDYYLKRAEAYEAISKFDEAYNDYTRAITFDDDDENRAKAGRAAYLAKNYNAANEQLDKSLAKDRGNTMAYEFKIRTLIAQQNFNKAQEVCENALLMKTSAINFYLSAVVLDNLGNFESAEFSFKKAISKDDELEDAYIGLADLQVRLNKPEEAMKEIQILLKLNPNNIEAYVVRSKIYVKRLDYRMAIDDISTCIIKQPLDERLFYLRGQYYQEFTQHQNAINDFSKVLQLNDKNAEALYKRAECYEQVANYKAAIKDYEALAILSEFDMKARKLLDSAKKRLFELNREANKPQLVLTDPIIRIKDTLELAKNKKEITIKGLIKDESEIETIQISGRNITFVKTDEGFLFSANINIESSEILTLMASDVYKNISQIKYNIKRTEIEPPKVNILAPYSSDNGDIYLDNNDAFVYIEGKIGDESLIKSILIDGIAASYKPDELNPTFAATVNLTNKNKIVVTATDIYGNVLNREFPLNKDGAQISADNPMGKTWVIFIENSNYQTFASLEGPIKDISLMKSALAKYKINNIIHKKDLGKKDLEKFFSIDLRDMVRSNRVNALLIWYAGHGKFINQTGYWIPTDANRDDEFTYFNINALKAALQSFGGITHLLVVTDACESGPTFYQAMRSTPKDRNCNDWKATKFKSSQVFSSAGYELASDNSQFTRTFANALANNPNACLPIENIVQKVTVAVSKGTQKPQFGKISGLEDEDGTFFFMTK